MPSLPEAVRMLAEGRPLSAPLQLTWAVYDGMRGTIWTRVRADGTIQEQRATPVAGALPQALPVQDLGVIPPADLRALAATLVAQHFDRIVVPAAPLSPMAADVAVELAVTSGPDRWSVRCPSPLLDQVPALRTIRDAFTRARAAAQPAAAGNAAAVAPPSPAGLSAVQTAIRQWQDKEIDGAALMRALVSYPQWQVPLSEAATLETLADGRPPRLMISQDPQGVHRFFIFSDSAAYEQFQAATGGVAPPYFLSTTGTWVFGLPLEEIDWLVIDPTTALEIAYDRELIARLAALAAAITVERALADLRAGTGPADTQLPVVRAYSGYLLGVRQAGDRVALARAPDDNGRELATVFTFPDTLAAFQDAAGPAPGGDVQALRLAGPDLFAELVRMQLDGVVFNCAGPPRPVAFAPGFAALVLGSSAAPPSVVFDGERYERAFSGAQPAGWTDEYIPPGETLDRWSRLVGVHLYRGFQDPQQFGLVFERQIKEANPRAGTRLQVRSDGQEALLDFLTWVTEPQPVWEFNVFRLFRAAEGVVGYQFAYRIYGTPDLQGQSFVPQREHWVSALQAAEFPPPGSVGSTAAAQE